MGRLGGPRATLVAPDDYSGHNADGEPHQEDDGYEDDCFDQFGHDGLPPFRAASVTASCVSAGAPCGVPGGPTIGAQRPTARQADDGPLLPLASWFVKDDEGPTTDFADRGRSLSVRQPPYSRVLCPEG